MFSIPSHCVSCITEEAHDISRTGADHILIDIGLDALHAVQCTCHGMDLKTLKARYGSKMVFNGGIDSHHVLIDGTPETVREETRKVLDIMKPGGGYVAGASHDWILEETPVENLLAMADTVRQFGGY